ncbi:MAG TPA: serpin family protein [Gemmatimonadaceae bacterium]
MKFHRVAIGAAFLTVAMVPRSSAQSAATGGTDSIARGPIRPKTDRALPFDAFGSHLFASLVARRGENENTVFSPLSAGLALSLVRMGAVGKTAMVLDSALGLTSLDRATIERRGAEMLSDLSGRTDVELETANAIWVDTAAVLTDAFSASTRRWRSSIATLPLSSQRAVAVVNRWADSVTHKKIRTILGEPLPDTARLLVTNAVYFKGKWLTPFEKSATKPGDFTLASGQRVSVPRMQRTMYVAYLRTPEFQVIRLPYRTGKTAMYVLLPDSGVSFDSLVTRIRAGSWMPGMRAPDLEEVRVVLPRFRSEATMDLAAPLQEDLGARLPFTCLQADFSAMARARALDRRMSLCIGAVFQKVYIDVDEEGTEAAAVTAIGMLEASGYHEPIKFIVDRPFLFVLRDEVIGADLFVGRIARP